MNKALMISMKPENTVNILNGKKTLELRTFIPKNYKGWVYVYVTNGVGKTKYHHLYNLTEYNNGKTLFSITHHNKHSLVPDDFLNSKVVFRFWFDEYDVMEYVGGHYEVNPHDIPLKLCLDIKQINDYGKGKTLYAWHIKKLEVFDTPKKLGEFQNYVGKVDDTPEWAITSSWQIFHRPLEKAPQKMQWVYAKEKRNE